MKTRKVILVANSVVKEIFFDKIYVQSLLAVFAFFGLSMVLGAMSFGERQRILAHFGWLSILLVGIVFSVTYAASFFNREISRQTLLVVLARPLSRTQYLLGSFLGLLLMMSLSTIGLSVVQFFFLQLSDGAELPFVKIVSGILFEQWVVLAFAFVLGLFFKPALAGTLAASLYFMGHWQEDFKFFIRGLDNAVLQAISFFVDWGLPALHSMNFRSVYFLENQVSSERFLLAGLHSVAWVCLVISLGIICFRRKDLAV